MTLQSHVYVHMHLNITRVCTLAYECIRVYMCMCAVCCSFASRVRGDGHVVVCTQSHVYVQMYMNEYDYMCIRAQSSTDV